MRIFKVYLCFIELTATIISSPVQEDVLLAALVCVRLEMTTQRFRMQT